MRAPKVRVARDSGYSLVELMVVIALLSVIGALVSGLVISTLRTSAGTRARLADVDNVRVAMDSVTRNLRTAIAPAQLGATCSPTCAAAFSVAAPCQVTFWANTGAAAAGEVDRPVQMTYQFVPAADGLTADLIEFRQQPDGTSETVASAWNGPVTQRTLLEGVAFDAARFGSGAGCSVGAATEPIFRYSTSTGLPTTDVTKVYAIDVRLPVRTPNALHEATTSAHTKVFLPNTAWRG